MLNSVSNFGPEGPKNAQGSDQEEVHIELEEEAGAKVAGCHSGEARPKAPLTVSQREPWDVLNSV